MISRIPGVGAKSSASGAPSPRGAPRSRRSCRGVAHVDVSASPIATSLSFSAEVGMMESFLSSSRSSSLLLLGGAAAGTTALGRGFSFSWISCRWRRSSRGATAWTDAFLRLLRRRLLLLFLVVLLLLLVSGLSFERRFARETRRARAFSHRSTSSTRSTDSARFSAGEDDGSPNRESELTICGTNCARRRVEVRLVRHDQVPDVDQVRQRVPFLDENLLRVSDPDRVLVVALRQALGSAGVSASSACRTSSLDSGWHARSSATKTCSTIFSGAWYASRKWHTLTNAHCFAPPSSRLEVVPPELDEFLAVAHERVRDVPDEQRAHAQRAARASPRCASRRPRRPPSRAGRRRQPRRPPSAPVSRPPSSSRRVAASASVASSIGITMSLNACVSSEGGALLFLNASGSAPARRGARRA